MGTTQSSARLDFRLRSDHKARIEQAAQMCGQSVSEFAVSALLREADEVLEKERMIRLSDRDFSLFMDLVDFDAEPNAALTRAAEQYRERRP